MLKCNRPQLAEVAIKDFLNTITDYTGTNYGEANSDKVGIDEDGNFVLTLTFAF